MDVPSYLLGKNAGGGGSYTETDPVFSASAASNITNDDIVKLGNLTPTYLGKISEHNTTETAIKLDGLKEGIYAIFVDTGNLYLSVTNTTSGKVVSGSTITGSSENSYIWYSTVYLYIKNDIPSEGLPTSNNEIARIIYKRDNLYGEQVSFLACSLPIIVANNSLTISTTGVSTYYYLTPGAPQTITAKKTFTVLPESSVVPTTDDQLVNKKYVDDNAGGGGASYTAGTNIEITSENVINNKIPYLTNNHETYPSKVIGTLMENTTMGTNAIGIGNEVNVVGVSSIAIGRKAEGKLENAIAIGSFAKANGNQTIAIGISSQANNAGMAIGREAKAEQKSIAFGWGAKTTKAGQVMFGGTFMSINELAIYDNGVTKIMATQEFVQNYLTTVSGYDSTKTQVLKNINGTMTWVDEA